MPGHVVTDPVRHDGKHREKSCCQFSSEWTTLVSNVDGRLSKYYNFYKRAKVELTRRRGWEVGLEWAGKAGSMLQSSKRGDSHPSSFWQSLNSTLVYSCTRGAPRSTSLRRLIILKLALSAWIARRTCRSTGRTDERTDGRTDGRTNGRTDGWTDGLKNLRTDGRTDDQTDGRTNGRMNALTHARTDW